MLDIPYCAGRRWRPIYTGGNLLAVEAIDVEYTTGSRGNVYAKAREVCPTLNDGVGQRSNCGTVGEMNADTINRSATDGTEQAIDGEAGGAPIARDRTQALKAAGVYGNVIYRILLLRAVGEYLSDAGCRRAAAAKDLNI